MAIVAINQIIADARCQSRQGIELGLVSEYAEAIRAGDPMPPLATVQSGGSYILFDGFHRLRAYEQVGVKHVEVESTPGDIWDAIERSCAVNAEHGKRRTNEDKHRAVETMIKVMEHRGENWSANEIAKRCAVSHTLVTNNTSYLSLNERYEDAPRTITRNGSTYEMNTANIGKSRAPKIDLDQFDFEPDDADEYIDDDGVIQDEPLPDRRPSIAPKTKDNYSPSVTSAWFEIPDDNAREAAILIRQNMLPETIVALVNHLEGRR